MSFNLFYGLKSDFLNKKIWALEFLDNHRLSIREEGPFFEILGHRLPDSSLVIGHWKERPLAVFKSEKDSKEEGIHIRDILWGDDPNLIQAVVRGSEMLSWLENHRYCGKCGKPTKILTKEPAMECTKCKHRTYPVLSPAVMVRIQRGNELLLATNRNFSHPIYSLVAGFVEAGETLEEAARREVMEEVGVEIENIKYFRNQSWPMPHTLLVGFTADYKRGDIQPDGQEIIDACWADPRERDDLPRKGSLAYEMIEDFITKKPI